MDKALCNNSGGVSRNSASATFCWNSCGDLTASTTKHRHHRLRDWSNYTANGGAFGNVLRDVANGFTL
jgi:hypothetical protein